jgi:hypothetical protein
VGVVERFFAWINRNRWLAKDFEASIASAGGLSLRHFGDAPHPPLGEIIMSFEPDSDAVSLPQIAGAFDLGCAMAVNYASARRDSSTTLDGVGRIRLSTWRDHASSAARRSST